MDTAFTRVRRFAQELLGTPRVKSPSPMPGSNLRPREREEDTVVTALALYLRYMEETEGEQLKAPLTYCVHELTFLEAELPMVEIRSTPESRSVSI